MSTLATARAEFAAALNSVDGVKYYPSPPSAPRAGDAWLRWRAERSDQGSGFDVTWDVVVIVPQGAEVAADDWIDVHLDALLAALRPVAYVTAYRPANLGPDNSPVYGLLITTDRE